MTGPLRSDVVRGDGDHDGRASSEREVASDPGMPRTAVAYTAIREAILSTRIPPGAPLVEGRLAVELRMSKTPIREALQRLASEDLVTLDRYRGATVRPVSQQLVADLYEIRELLEPLATRQAVPRLGPDAMRDLRHSVADSGDALERFDIPAMGQAAWRFHSVFIDHATNPPLQRILRGIEDQFRSFTTVIWLDRSARTHEQDDHERILAAVEAGDAEGASRLMGDHLASFKTLVIDSVGQPPIAPTTPW